MTTITGYPRLSAAERELREGRFDAASALAIQHLRQHRNEPRGLALIATIALKTGALVQAEQFFRRAIAAGARSLEVQRDLAAAINQQERLGDALRAFTALQQKVADPQIRSVRALILDKLGRHADALKVHEELVAMFPDEPQYLIGYGLALRSAGKTDEAFVAYRHVTSLDPERG
jgi:tetratricopeptide (TPR) repeat protein